jgi:hypothetical protein
MKKNKDVKPALKFDEMTNDRLAEAVFGKRLKKKLDKIAHSGELGHKSNQK